MNTSTTLTPPAAPPQLRSVRFEDYPQIQKLEARFLGGALAADEWPRVWLDNPLWPRVGSQWSIGWLLEDAAGQVVASLCSIPSLYHYRGRELLCAQSKTWVAIPEYRAFAPWLMEEFFNQPGVDLVIASTANASAEPVVSSFADRVPSGDWETLAYWVTGYRGFARKALEKLGIPLASVWAYPAAVALWLKEILKAKPLPSCSSDVVVSAIDRFDSRFDLFWEELVRQNPDKLLAARDCRTLTWHYAISLRERRLWILTAVRNGLLCAYCVLRRDDWTPHFHRVRLIDYQTVEPDIDLLPVLLQAALKRCAAEDVYVLEHLGFGLPKMRSFDSFAPYRRKLPNWPYYFHASDPALDAELHRPECWDPSEFDGAGSIG